jgi:hypothetical protein
MGERPDPTGGGLVRSRGGWSMIKALRKDNVHFESSLFCFLILLKSFLNLVV